MEAGLGLQAEAEKSFLSDKLGPVEVHTGKTMTCWHDGMSKDSS